MKKVSIKEFIKQWKLLNEQSKHIKSMINELNHYIRYSADNDIDYVNEITDRMDTIREFSEK